MSHNDCITEYVRNNLQEKVSNGGCNIQDMDSSDSFTEERKCFVEHHVEVYLHEFGPNKVCGRGEIIEIKKKLL
jgi:hypothetical protein